MCASGTRRRRPAWGWAWGWAALCLFVSGALACGRSSGVPEAFVDIPLVDQDGRVIRSSFFAGEVLVLNFMFTSCPSVCPRQTRLIAETRVHLPDHVAQRVRFLSVSVDPENDDARTLKAFAERWGADVPSWRFARVDERTLGELSKRLLVFEPGAPPQPAAHTSSLYLFDRAGRLVQRYGARASDPERLAREIVALDALGRPQARHGDRGVDAAPFRALRAEEGLR